MSEPAFVGRSHVYWVAPLHGVRHLPFRYETFGPIDKRRNPQAVRAAAFIAEWDAAVAVADRAEAITESQIKQIAKAIYRWQNRRQN